MIFHILNIGIMAVVVSLGCSVAMGSSLASSQQKAPQKSSQKYQSSYEVEVGLKLTPEAFRGLLSRANWTAKSRVDHYVDFFDGQHFLLQSSAEAYRLRLKDNGKKEGTFQLKTESADPLLRVCPGFGELAVKERIVDELKLGRREIDQFVRLHRQNLDFSRVEAVPSAQARRSYWTMDQWVRSLPFPRLAELAKLTSSKAFFVASHEGQKTKWWLENGPSRYDISITHGREFLGTEFVQDKYEIEFQFATSERLSPGHADEIANALCSFITQQALHPTDLTPVRKSPQEISRLRLEQWGQALFAPSQGL